jgi:hypothetical protein
MCEMIFSWIVCVTAAVSGYFWLRSAVIDIPPMTYESVGPEGAVTVAFARQAKFNKAAAWAASAAAICQALSILVKGH